MGRFDTTVTNESLTRRGGEISEIELEMQRGKASYFVQLDVDDGDVTFDKVSPVRSLGGNFTGGFSTGVKMMDVTKTLAVMNAAKEYVDEHYDFDVPRCLWLAKEADAA